MKIIKLYMLRWIVIVFGVGYMLTPAVSSETFFSENIEQSLPAKRGIFFGEALLATNSVSTPVRPNINFENSLDIDSDTDSTSSLGKTTVRRPFMQGDVTWERVLSENFDGSTLDTDLWEPGRFPGHFGDPGWSKAVNLKEAACYHEGQVKISGGKLHLTARETTPEEYNKCRFGDGKPGASYVSGYVTTRGKFFVEPGMYVEASIGLPGKNLELFNWVQFWLTDIDQIVGNWPEGGEIDIVETLEGKACANYHYEKNSNHFRYNIGEILCENLVPGENIFALLWTPNGNLKFFYNGNEVGGGEYVVDTVELAGDIALSYRHNIELGYGLPKIDMTPPTSPQTMTVEYIDVYKINTN